MLVVVGGGGVAGAVVVGVDGRGVGVVLLPHNAPGGQGFSGGVKRVYSPVLIVLGGLGGLFLLFGQFLNLRCEFSALPGQAGGAHPCLV